MHAAILENAQSARKAPEPMDADIRDPTSFEGELRTGDESDERAYLRSQAPRSSLAVPIPGTPHHGTKREHSPSPSPQPSPRSGSEYEYLTLDRIRSRPKKKRGSSFIASLFESIMHGFHHITDDFHLGVDVNLSTGNLLDDNDEDFFGNRSM
jgi:hypothetical protein